MSQPTPTTEPLGADVGALLAEFARTCKVAARAVSLYPGTHPAIAVSLSRLVTAAARLTNNARFAFGVQPQLLTIGGRAPARADAAIGELASLLHERLIGELTIEQDADTEDWRTLLLLLARAPEELMATGGITQAWQQTGRTHFAIREIDYAAVLRERAGGHRAQWDRIIESCLQGDRAVMDDAAIAALLQAVSTVDSFGDLLDHFQRLQAMSGVGVSARVAALLQLMRSALDAVRSVTPDEAEQATQTMADACARLNPDLMLALLESRHANNPIDAQMARAIVDRVSERCVASFVARSVTTERRATDETVRALDALAPDPDLKNRVLDLAHDEAKHTDAGHDAGFEALWQNALATLKGTGTGLVSIDDTALATPHQVVDVEHASDDPPDRIHAWVDSVSETAVHALDFELLRDLLRIELEPSAWEEIAVIVVAEIERRVLQSDIAAARALADSLVGEMGSRARPPLRQIGTRVLERLWSGPLVRHVALNLRKDEANVDELNQLCYRIGAGLARPLAELLAVEENPRATRRLRELLLGFGAAGRQSVEQLKHSPNPAVRRTAIDLLRVFGGQEALAELASMLDDTDPQVQRESIRAIVQIGTTNAYAVLQRALVTAGTSRDTVLEELLGMRDDKTAPLLCYVLRNTEPEGTLYRIHADMIDALGNLKPHAESVRTLRHVLYRGKWWSPFRTSALRQRAALALRRLGTPEATSVLDEAVAGKARGARRAARAQLARVARAERGKE